MTKQDLILTAACEIMRGQGFRKVTRDAVAEQAGVAHGLVSYYFGSMEGLFKAMTDKFIADGDGPMMQAAKALGLPGSENIQ